MFPYNEILKVLKVKLGSESEASTQDTSKIPNFIQISEGVWELRVFTIYAYVYRL